MSMSNMDQKVNMKKFGENYDKIDWGNKKAEKQDEEKPKQKKCCRKKIKPCNRCAKTSKRKIKNKQ